MRCSVRGCTYIATDDIYGNTDAANLQHFWRTDGRVCAEHAEAFRLHLDIAGHRRDQATHTTRGGRGVVGRLKP